VLYFLVEGARERRVDRRARKMAQRVVAQHAAANHYAS
jgi:hypothetical protein